MGNLPASWRLCGVPGRNQDDIYAKQKKDRAAGRTVRGAWECFAIRPCSVSLALPGRPGRPGMYGTCTPDLRSGAHTAWSAPALSQLRDCEGELWTRPRCRTGSTAA